MKGKAIHSDVLECTNVTQWLLVAQSERKWSHKCVIVTCEMTSLFQTALFDWSLSAAPHLGPDGIRLEPKAQARLKSLYKHTSHGDVKKDKQIWRYEMKENRTLAAPYKRSWTIIIVIVDFKDYLKSFSIQVRCLYQLFDCHHPL